MGTIYGESSITSYASNGGIAVMSADVPPGAITGGSGDSEEGSSGSITRIRWWIAYDESTDTYSGGITGVGWFRSSDPEAANLTVSGPFEGATEADIYSHASNPTEGNLDFYFNAWNNSTSPSDILTFQTYILNNAQDCITIGGIGG